MIWSYFLALYCGQQCLKANKDKSVIGNETDFGQNYKSVNKLYKPKTQN